MTNFLDLDFFVLEQRPTNSGRPQSARMLEANGLSLTGMRLMGRPKYNVFPCKLRLPNTHDAVDATVKVTRVAHLYFEVEFEKPSQELIEALSYFEGL